MSALLRSQPKALWRYPILLVCVALLAAYWAAATLVLTNDPFDVYAWGKPVALDRDNLTDDSKLLVSAIAKDPKIDLLMIGSSTTRFYSVEDLRAAFPDAGHPYNFTYHMVRPSDRNISSGILLRHTRARRVIIWLDWAYALPPAMQVEAFPAYQYDEAWFNDLRMVNGQGLSATLDRLSGRPMFSDWRDRLGEEHRGDRTIYAAFQSAAGRAALGALVTKNRGMIDRPGARTCAELPGFTAGLLPQLEHWAASGRRADIVIPAYSPAFYYSRADGTGLKLSDQLMLRRCLVEGVADLPTVRVIALDLLPRIHAIGKLARQMETSDAAKPIYRGADHWGAARARGGREDA